MTNKPMLSVERELRALAEKACGTAKGSPEYRRFLEAVNPTIVLDLTAEPAAQHQGEPVAWVIGTEDGNGADYYPGKGLDTLEIGAKLYAEQPAPVATIARLMEAVHAIPGFPGVTGTQLRQLVEYLTGVKP